MGFFSWKTIDRNRSISNVYSKRGALAVVLLVPKQFGGKNLIEIKYEGYGYFQEKDAYALLAQWNRPDECIGKDEIDREIGIDIGGEDEQIEKLIYPLKFVSLDYYNRTNCKYEDLKAFSKSCPLQGYFYR